MAWRFQKEKISLIFLGSKKMITINKEIMFTVKPHNSGHLSIADKFSQKGRFSMDTFFQSSTALGALGRKMKNYKFWFPNKFAFFIYCNHCNFIIGYGIFTSGFLICLWNVFIYFRSSCAFMFSLINHHYWLFLAWFLQFCGKPLYIADTSE